MGESSCILPLIIYKNIHTIRNIYYKYKTFSGKVARHRKTPDITRLSKIRNVAILPEIPLTFCLLLLRVRCLGESIRPNVSPDSPPKVTNYDSPSMSCLVSLLFRPEIQHVARTMLASRPFVRGRYYQRPNDARFSFPYRRRSSRSLLSWPPFVRQEKRDYIRLHRGLLTQCSKGLYT